MDIYRPADGVEFVGTENGHECHYYRLNGERVPFSLTQILELAGLSRQPQSDAERHMWDAKAKLGTRVHEYTLWLDQEEIALEDLKAYPAYYNRVLGWQQFRQDFEFSPDLSSCEVPMAVRLNGCLYAFKADAYGIMGPEDKMAMAVVEKKCTVNIEPHHAIQTAAQAIAFRPHAEGIKLPLRRFVVQLLETPNGSGRYYRAEECTDRTDEKIFAAALATVSWRYGKGLLK